MRKNVILMPARLSLLLTTALLATSTLAHAETGSRMLSQQPQPPDVRLGPLFSAVQKEQF